MPGIYKNQPPKSVFGDELIRQIMTYGRERRLGKADTLAEFFTWKAAWYMMTGRNLPNSDQEVDFAKLENIANQLKEKGAGRYAQMAYLNTVPTPTIRDLNYDVFLTSVWDDIVLAPYNGIDFDGHREALQHSVENRRGVYSCVEAMTLAARNVDEAPNRRYSNENVSTYEYNAPETAWNTYAYVSSCVRGNGIEPYTNQTINETKKRPFDVLVMKNKQTVEKINNREFGKVRDAYMDTVNSFTFANRRDLREAQSMARGFLGRLESSANLVNVAQNPDWSDLLDRFQEFAIETDPQKAAEKSAAVLLAVEKFSKGKKSLWASAQDRAMVADALSMLAICVPDVRENPSVKPLIDRFNKVRAHRFQDSVRLENYGFHAVAPGSQNTVTVGQQIQSKENTREQAISNDLYSADRNQPGQNQPAQNQPGRNQPAQNQPGQNQPAQNQPAPNQPAPQNDNSADYPVPLNLKAPDPAPDRDGEDFEDLDEGNDIQDYIYGEDQHDADEDYEKQQAYLKQHEPISVKDAFIPARNFMNLIKQSSFDEISEMDEDMIAKEFATALALNYTKPYDNEPTMINKKKIVENTETAFKHKVVKQMASDFVSTKNFHDKLIQQINKFEATDQPEKAFCSFINSLSIAFDQEMKKREKNAKNPKPNQEEEKELKPEEKEMPKKSILEDEKEDKKEDLKEDGKENEQKIPNKEEQPDAASERSSASLIDPNQRYTEVSM